MRRKYALSPVTLIESGLIAPASRIKDNGGIDDWFFMRWLASGLSKKLMFKMSFA